MTEPSLKTLAREEKASSTKQQCSFVIIMCRYSDKAELTWRSWRERSAEFGHRNSSKSTRVAPELIRFQFKSAGNFRVNDLMFKPNQPNGLCIRVKYGMKKIKPSCKTKTKNQQVQKVITFQPSHLSLYFQRHGQCSSRNASKDIKG